MRADKPPFMKNGKTSAHNAYEATFLSSRNPFVNQINNPESSIAQKKQHQMSMDTTQMHS